MFWNIVLHRTQSSKKNETEQIKHRPVTFMHPDGIRDSDSALQIYVKGPNYNGQR